MGVILAVSITVGPGSRTREEKVCSYKYLRLQLFWPPPCFIFSNSLIGTNIHTGVTLLCYGEMLNYKINRIPDKLWLLPKRVNTKKRLPLSCGNQACAVHLIKKDKKIPQIKRFSCNQRTCTGSHQHVWNFRVLYRWQTEGWDKRDEFLVILVTWADAKEIWD